MQFGDFEESAQNVLKVSESHRQQFQPGEGEDKFVRLRKQLSELSPLELSIYSFLRMKQGAHKSVQISIKELMQVCSTWTNPSQSKAKCLEAIGGLRSKGCISNIQIYDAPLTKPVESWSVVKPTQQLIVNVVDLDFSYTDEKGVQRSGTVNIDYHEFMTIATASIKGVKKEVLYMLFVGIINYINRDSKKYRQITYSSWDNLSRVTGVPLRTVEKYMPILLNELNLLVGTTYHTKYGSQAYIMARPQDYQDVWLTYKQLIDDGNRKVVKERQPGEWDKISTSSTMSLTTEHMENIESTNKKTKVEIILDPSIERWFSNKDIKLNSTLRKKIKSFDSFTADVIVKTLDDITFPGMKNPGGVINKNLTEEKIKAIANKDLAEKARVERQIKNHVQVDVSEFSIENYKPKEKKTSDIDEAVGVLFDDCVVTD